MKQAVNKYYKRFRISEKVFQKILYAFAMDLTATDAAQLMGLSVRRVNDIYTQGRARIVWGPYCRLPNLRLPPEGRANDNLIKACL